MSAAKSLNDSTLTLSSDV